MDVFDDRKTLITIAVFVVLFLIFLYVSFVYVPKVSLPARDFAWLPTEEAVKASEEEETQTHDASEAKQLIRLALPTS